MVVILVMFISIFNEVMKIWFFQNEVCDMWIMFDMFCCMVFILYLVVIFVNFYWVVINIDFV